MMKNKTRSGVFIPFQNELVIELNEESKINIYETSGKSLAGMVLPAGRNVMAFTYEPGIYFVQLIQPDGSTRWTRLIKEN